MPYNLCIEALWPDNLKRFQASLECKPTLLWWRHYQAWIIGFFCIMLLEHINSIQTAKAGINGIKGGKNTMCCSSLICQSCYVLQLFPLFFIKALCQSLVPHRVTILNCCKRKKNISKRKVFIKMFFNSKLTNSLPF